jgi:HD superfamily phosphodiesterase
MFDEQKIISIIGPNILRCRPGDWEHAKRVVEWVKKLGEKRADLPLLITAGYIHDIGWRDLFGDNKMTFAELLRLEPQANANSETYIREVLEETDFDVSEVETILRLVSAADKHESTIDNDDEEIIVDADQLSKLCIDHLNEKYEKSEWIKMYELLSRELSKRIKTEKAKSVYPQLLASLKESIDFLR